MYTWTRQLLNTAKKWRTSEEYVENNSEILDGDISTSSLIFIILIYVTEEIQRNIDSLWERQSCV